MDLPRGRTHTHTRKKLNISMSIISTFLTVPGQTSPRFHVEAWLPFRNCEMEYWPWKKRTQTEREPSFWSFVLRTLEEHNHVTSDWILEHVHSTLCLILNLICRWKKLLILRFNRLWIASYCVYKSIATMDKRTVWLKTVKVLLFIFPDVGRWNQK